METASEMLDEEREDALRAANAAISGRQHRAAKRFASIELRAVDQNAGAWEAAALGSIAVVSFLAVLAIWFL